MRSDPGAAPSPVFRARFSDGADAVSRAAEVRLGAAGLEIAIEGRPDPLSWPYASLSTSMPITVHAIDALVTSSTLPRAVLFVPDAVFVRRLAERAPQLTARSVRWGHAAPWAWGGLAVLLLAMTVWLLDLSPARAVAKLLPDKARVALGSQVVRSMTEGRRVCAAPEGRAALDALAVRLSGAAGTGTRFTIVVVDWGLLNAFATPGEQIVLTKGLIAKAGSADEVAGVLAHEMGHGIELHPEASVVRALGLSAATDLLLGGSGGAIANIGVVLAQLSYTRGAEREADRHALRILRAAAISPKGIADFFRRVDRLETGGQTDTTVARKGPRDRDKERGKLPGLDILSTHPQSDERAAQAERVAPYPSTPALTPAQWQALRDICTTSAAL